ncbi:MAG: phosphatidylglycerophosphatase A, partial [Balneolaceae bacterium]
SLLTSDTCVRAWGEDPSRFVLDEFAGQSIPFLFIPFGHTFTTDLMILFTGFILFRIFDIIKPLGIDRLQKFPGKFGILLDDIAAGVYAFVCLHSVIYLANLLF